jgi:hypothetical protein
LVGFEVTLYGRFWVTPEGQTNNVFGRRSPIIPSRPEFGPKRLQHDFLDHHVSLRNIEIHTGSRFIPDDISEVPVKEVSAMLR